MTEKQNNIDLWITLHDVNNLPIEVDYVRIMVMRRVNLRIINNRFSTSQKIKISEYNSYVPLENKLVRFFRKNDIYMPATELELVSNSKILVRESPEMINKIINDTIVNIDFIL